MDIDKITKKQYEIRNEFLAGKIVEFDLSTYTYVERNSIYNFVLGLCSFTGHSIEYIDLNKIRFGGLSHNIMKTVKTLNDFENLTIKNK